MVLYKCTIIIIIIINLRQQNLALLVTILISKITSVLFVVFSTRPLKISFFAIGVVFLIAYKLKMCFFIFRIPTETKVCQLQYAFVCIS